MASYSKKNVTEKYSEMGTRDLQAFLFCAHMQWLSCKLEWNNTSNTSTGNTGFYLRKIMLPDIQYLLVVVFGFFREKAVPFGWGRKIFSVIFPSGCYGKMWQALLMQRRLKTRDQHVEQCRAVDEIYCVSKVGERGHKIWKLKTPFCTAANSWNHYCSAFALLQGPYFTLVSYFMNQDYWLWQECHEYSASICQISVQCKPNSGPKVEQNPWEQSRH